VDGGRAALAKLGRPVRPSELRAGDVLVFSAPGVPVATLGVYLGDGAFVHAPADAPQVTLASLYQPRFTEAYAGARRY
jgi:cell wall-associated NlpC family hydrolase